MSPNPRRARKKVRRRRTPRKRTPAKWSQGRIMLSMIRNPATALTLAVFTCGLSAPSAASLFHGVFCEPPSLPADFSSEQYSLLAGFYAGVFFLSLVAVDAACRRRLGKKHRSLKDDCIWMDSRKSKWAFLVQITASMLASPIAFRELCSQPILQVVIVLVIALGPFLLLLTARPFAEEDKLSRYLSAEAAVRNSFGNILIWAVCLVFIFYAAFGVPPLMSFNPCSARVILLSCVVVYFVAFGICVGSCRSSAPIKNSR